MKVILVAEEKPYQGCHDLPILWKLGPYALTPV